MTPRKTLLVGFLYSGNNAKQFTDKATDPHAQADVTTSGSARGSWRGLRRGRGGAQRGCPSKPGADLVSSFFFLLPGAPQFFQFFPGGLRKRGRVLAFCFLLASNTNSNWSLKKTESKGKEGPQVQKRDASQTGFRASLWPF